MVVKAAVDLEYGGKFFSKGTVLPAELVKEFEEHQPERLSNMVEVNGRWFKIDDKRIAGFVKENKNSIKRLKDHFGIKDVPKKDKEPSNEHMLRSRPKPVEEEPKKLSDKEFIALNRKAQEKELNKLNIKFSRSDKEKDLLKKYLAA